MHPLLLLWDIDGTLITTGGGGREAIRHALLNRYGILDDLGDVQMAGRTDTSICMDISKKYETHSIDVNELLEAYLECLPVILGQYKGKVHLGVKSILDWSHAHSEAHNALLTGNIKRGAFIKLGHYGLNQFFEFGAFGDDSSDRNDLGPIALDRARNLLKKDFHIEYTWVIGDTPKDIACARALGCKVMAVATGDYTTKQLKSFEPDLLFEDFSDYKTVITQLETY
jgi:phosphoglycolate phosphatase